MESLRQVQKLHFSQLDEEYVASVVLCNRGAVIKIDTRIRDRPAFEAVLLLIPRPNGAER